MVSLRQLLAALSTFGAGRPRDLQHPPFDAAAAVAQLGAGRPGNPGDLLHRAGQHPHPVAQQAAKTTISPLFRKGTLLYLAGALPALSYNSSVDLEERVTV